jgi:hypothetical protein
MGDGLAHVVGVAVHELLRVPPLVHLGREAGGPGQDQPTDHDRSDQGDLRPPSSWGGRCTLHIGQYGTSIRLTDRASATDGTGGSYGM